MTRWLLGSSALLTLLGLPLACGSTADSSADSDHQGGSGGSYSAGGNQSGGSLHAGGSTQGGANQTNPQGGSAGSAGSNSGFGGGGNTSSDAGTEDAHFPDVNFDYDAPFEQPDACAATTVATQLKPLDMYIMLDRSASMVEPGYSWSNSGGGFIWDAAADCNVGDAIVNSRWCRSVNALGQYFLSADSSGNRAAIHYFPHGQTNECNLSDYLSPSVGLTSLPSASNGALITSLNNATPGGWNTPTEGAVHGLNDFTGALSDPSRQAVSILITDGKPTKCDSNISNLAALLEGHYTTHQVPTYVIGMTGLETADFNNLEAMAQNAGSKAHPNNTGSLTNTCGNGASSCHHWNVGNGDPAVFVEALRQIQKQAVGCNLDIPLPGSGAPDWNQVEVEYEPGNGGPAQNLPKVPNAAACGGAPGWYYDNPASPTQVVLCPASCDTVQDDLDAQVNLLLGCLGA